MTRTREQESERARKGRESNREVVIPACSDRERRELLESCDEEWLRYYFDGPCLNPFSYAFTHQQLEMVRAIRNAIQHGGDQAIAASRGEGKTSIVERLLLKYSLQGVVSFSVLFSATGSAAENSLESIKSDIADTERLYEDYPEVCHPVRSLENTPNRAHYQIVTGKRHDNGAEYIKHPSKFSWCGHEISFPNVPGSPSAAAVIATRGLDAAVRGLKKRGKRPQLAVIDDPDTEETARSDDQAKKLEDRIDKGIGGLGGQRRPIARVILTTLQSRMSASYKFTDPKQKPTWFGRRFRFLVKPPTRLDLWDEYGVLAQQNMQAGDEYARGAHAFFLANRAAMETGSEVANPHRFDSTLLEDGTQKEVSALQRYYNEVVRVGAEAVATELDNDPPDKDEGVDRLLLTAHRIQHNCLSGLERRIIPDGTTVLTIGGDVQKKGLHWVLLATDDRGAGCIVDYDFYSFGTEGRAASDCEIAILEGLHTWRAALLENPHTKADGEIIPIDLALIDMGWKDETWAGQPVQAFCYACPGNQFLPSKGTPHYRRPKDSRTTVVGDNWHCEFPRPFVAMNSDHWKLKVHEGFMLELGAPGSLSLFNHPKIDGRLQRNFHLSFAKHILAESWETRVAPGFKRPETKWWHFGKPNHYFDATYQAIVARAVRGMNVLSIASKVAAPAKPVAVPAKQQATQQPAQGAARNQPTRRRIDFRRRS